jgi:hypothetical protein
MNRTRILTYIVPVCIFLLVSGLVFAQDDVRTFQTFDADSINRITFTYSTQIAQDAVWEWVPESPDFRRPTGPIPEYTQITFQNYDEQQGWVSSGQVIYVYPTVTFPDNPDYPFAVALTDLQQVLAARPAVPDTPLPMLPIVTASQPFHAQAQYLDFPGGSGIRYVAAAVLDQSPLSDHTIFYTFQGLTDDNAYYIAALFPLASTVLPSDAPPMTAEEYNNFAANYGAYISDLTQQLNEAAPTSFEPDLTLIDDIFTSMQITPPAATVITPDQTQLAVAAYENVVFSYAPVLASRIEIDEIAPLDDPGGMSMFGSQPGYTVFSLFGYPLVQPNNDPRIRVIPVDGFPASGTVWNQQLEELKNFLEARLPLEAQSAASGAQPIPVLPPINAAQVIVAKPEYLDFRNGFGVRFITFYSQGIDPVTNDRLFYSFIGITDDGQYVVSVSSPVTAPVLSEIDYTNLDYDAFSQNYTEYIEQTLSDLDELDAQAYTPALDVLDDLIRSVEIGS